MIFNHIWKDQGLYSEYHSRRKEYGIGGASSATKIHALATQTHVKTILDYGCGKGDLLKALSKYGTYSLSGYDPSVVADETISNTISDEPIDMIVSTDVLEHVPKDELEMVWNIFRAKNPKTMFHRICGRLASAILPDGSNAHKTVENFDWWDNELKNAFTSYDVVGEPSKAEKHIFNFTLKKKG